MGTLLWQADSTAPYFTEYMSTNAIVERLGMNGTQLARLADDTDTVTFTMNVFRSSVREERGRVSSVTIGTCTATTNVRFVCEP